MLKRTTIAVLGLMASGYAAAGTMGPACIPGNVTVPCEGRAWDISAEALYMRSLYTGEKSYQLRPNLVIGEDSHIHDNQNDWHWGFRVMGAYHFNTGNDITINWTHLYGKADTYNILAPFIVPTTGSVTMLPANYVERTQFDQANIVLGQHVDVSARDKMRFYGGMQYANIQSTATNNLTYPLIAALVGSTVSVFDNTDFKGIGPTAGIDYSYDLFSGFINGLSLTANGSGSLLIGTTRYHEGFVVNNLNAIYAQVYARKKAVVPSVEAKLGLNYGHNFLEGTLNLDAGYQVVNYFNPLSAQAFQNPTAPITSVNYGFFGPYFGLKYVGNV